MKQATPKKGWYARIEGPDGAGKSSIIALAKTYAEANGIDVVFIREPGTGEFGEKLRDMLLHAREFDLSPQTEYALLTANRTHLVSDVILPALNKGYVVISDRGIESSVTMQGGAAGAIAAKRKGSNASLSVDDILTVGAVMLPEWYMKPDGLVLLSLSKETRRERMGAKVGLDKIEQRTMEYSDAVHDGYIHLETALSHATVINSEQHPDKIFNQARAVLFGPDHA